MPVRLSDIAQPYRDSDEELAELLLPSKPKPLAKTRWLSTLAYIWTIGTAALLVAAIWLITVDAQRLKSLDEKLPGFIEKTNLRYGYGASLPAHAFAGKTFEATRVRTSDTPAATARELAVVFPQSIDIIHDEHPDDVFEARGNVEITDHASTILQFGLPNGLLERTDCQIGGLFPSFEKLGSKSVTMTLSFLNVWLLEGHREVNAKPLIPGGPEIHPVKANFTYNDRPARQTLLGELRPKMGEIVKSNVFKCPRKDEVISVEITCKPNSPACLVSLDEVLTLPALGFELMAI